MRLIQSEEPVFAASMGPTRLPRSSFAFDHALPSEDAAPWVCLSRPNAPVVLRRYLSTSRRCDVVSESGRWIIESCLVPRTPQDPEYVQLGWDLAIGDVEPGWCIVYAGARLWFPQRVLRVDIESDDWQRIWTLSDATTRHVWPDNVTYALDNGIAEDWAVDDFPAPRWEPDGPWWPLQSEPLNAPVRRFVLDGFNLAVECASCGGFGEPVSSAGCLLNLWDPAYQCDCGFSWRVGRQGNLDTGSLLSGAGDEESQHESSADEGPLNYDMWDESPYGLDAERYVDDAIESLLPEIGPDDYYHPDVIRKYFGISQLDEGQ